MENLMTDIYNLSYPTEFVFLSSKPEEKQSIISAAADYFVVTNTPPDELLHILDKLRMSKTENLPTNF